MTATIQAKRGPRRRDGLLDRLEKLKPGGHLVLSSARERNRALKFGRERGRLFVTRGHPDQPIRLWRLE